MGLLARMAMRSLARRPVRTGITVGAAGLSVVLTLLFMGLTEGSHVQMVDMAVRLQAGHVVIQAPGFSEDRTLEKRIADPRAVLARMGALPEGGRVVSRIFAAGLLRSSETSVMIDPLIGVDPDEEAKISLVPRRIVRGSWLTPGSPGLLIGEKTAHLLQVDVGDRVVLSCSGLTQKVEERLEIVGIFRMGGETDRSMAMVDRSFAAGFLGLGTAVHQMAVFLPAGTDAHAVRDRLRGRLSGMNVEVLHWQEALPVLNQLLQLDSASMYVLLLVIFGIVAAGILNSVLMSVLERTREFGILRSLGMPPKLLFLQVMLENLFLGVAAVAVGCAAGLPLHAWLTRHGLDILAFTGGEVVDVEGVAFVDRLYPVLGISDVALTAAWVVAIALASAFFPAMRAAAIRPVKAMRS